jgi:hypothetical protein
MILVDLVKATGEPNPHAIEAARAVAGLVAVPDFGENRPEDLKDFNDLAALQGREAVAECIRRQMAAREEEGKPRPGNGAAPGDETGSASFAEGRPGPEDAPGSDSQDLVALEIGELLKRDFPAKESLLSPWLRRQDLIMIYSKRGVGKTHLCLTLAYAVASGGKFLKWEAPEPRRVLYIDGEMPGVAIQERLAALVDANEKEPPEGFFRIVTPDAQTCSLPDLATVAGQSEIDP